MLTLNDAEERLLKMVIWKPTKGSLAFELRVRLFESPRSACCGAAMETAGQTTHYYWCPVCDSPASPREQK